jgi:hypothetical protein
LALNPAIFNGNKAYVVPYFVTLTTSTRKCGGALVSNVAALTSASCIEG